MLGETVGSYRITARLGQGGMGVVWIAEHPLIGRKAAVKTLLPELSTDRDLVNRFFNEARSSALIKHPGIVDIFDFGHHASGCAYLVMEFLEGESLGSRVRGAGALPEATAMGLIRQAASALAAAHAKGIVHRDLKPDNMFLVPDAEVSGGERLKILDFGIAKLSKEAPGASKTRTGSVMGSPSYMSPEQCKGAGLVDERSDVYSLGCVAFELLTGRPPFLAEGVGEVLAMHIYEAPPTVRSVAPEVRPELDTLIARCLAKKPEERVASMVELAKGIDAAMGTSTAQLRAQTPPTGSRAGSVSPVKTPAPVITPAMMAPTVAPPSSPPGLLSPPPTGTTLSGAAGAMEVDAPARKKRGPLLLVGGVVVAAGATLAVVLGGGGGGAKTAAGPAAATPAPAIVDSTPAATPDAAPAPAVAPPPAAAPALPAKIVIGFTSDPAGADVFRLPAGVRVGKTPFDTKISSVEGEVVFVVRKSGYVEQEVVARGDADSRHEVKLDKIGSAEAKSRSGKKRPPPPTTGPIKPVLVDGDGPPPKPDPPKVEPPVEPKRKKGEALDPLGE